MKYFLVEEERKKSGSSCYFEFQKGPFKSRHWLKDSLCLHADTFDALILYRLFSGVIDDFSSYAPNEVSPEQWERLVERSKENEQWKCVIEELIPWAEECFAEYNCFTVCGI